MKGEGSPLWGNVNDKDTKNVLGLSTVGYGSVMLFQSLRIITSASSSGLS
jgi:hypothetical protein